MAPPHCPDLGVNSRKPRRRKARHPLHQTSNQSSDPSAACASRGSGCRHPGRVSTDGRWPGETVQRGACGEVRAPPPGLHTSHRPGVADTVTCTLLIGKRLRTPGCPVFPAHTADPASRTSGVERPRIPQSQDMVSPERRGQQAQQACLHVREPQAGPAACSSHRQQEPSPEPRSPGYSSALSVSTAPARRRVWAGAWRPHLLHGGGGGCVPTRGFQGRRRRERPVPPRCSRPTSCRVRARWPGLRRRGPITRRALEHMRSLI